jgi:hypothetical protein
VAEQRPDAGTRDRAAESGVCGEKRRRWERQAAAGPMAEPRGGSGEQS